MRTYSPHVAIETIVHSNPKFPFLYYAKEQMPTLQGHYNPNWHNDVEIIYVIKGKLDINIHSTPVEVTAPALIVTPSKHIHSIKKYQPTTEISMMLFDPEMIRLAYFDDEQNELYDFLLNPSNEPFILTCKNQKLFEKVKTTYNLIVEAYLEKKDESHLFIKANLLLLLCFLNKANSIDRNLQVSQFEYERQQKLKELIIWIHDHHSGPLSIADAASKMGVSQTYFCRFFKQATKMSFTQYVNEYRLKKACDDILVGKKCISEIASSHGFENESYFFRVFKKKYGVTPLSYRSKIV